MSVSVIIPTFNRAQLLERCLASLFKAGVPDLEVIVVDDGGTDDSAAICRKFPGTRYIWQENAGVSEARNHGFRVSTGRYVAFIDSDDEWTNGGLRRLAAECERHPDIGVLFADTLIGNDQNGFVSFVDTYGGKAFAEVRGQVRDSSVKVFERDAFLVQLSTRNVMFLGSMVFRRDAFEALGGFVKALSGAADWNIFMRAAATTTVAFSQGAPLANYYIHGSGMATNFDHMASDYIKALDHLRTHVQLSPGVARHVDRRIREHAFGWAYQAYERGDFASARTRLSLSRELGQLGPREGLYWLATFLPPGVVTTLRRVRHAFGS